MEKLIKLDTALNAVDERINELRWDKQFNIAEKICISGVKKHLLSAETKTEYEIIKPYLENIKAEINKVAENDGFTSYGDYSDLFDCVNRMLWNLHRGEQE